ncbi:MAG: Hsp20/alpha crystallin family protein [Planctomycetota bacterium]|nr:MAG: Hsp20/alpha crystallin family protein [Planctomycetota bacterium]
MVYRRANSTLPVVRLRDEMDRLVSDFFSPAGAAAAWGGPAPSFPALNVWEEDDVLYAEAEVPGLKSEDLEISVIAGDLTLRGRRGGEAPEGTAYHRQERGTGEFNRVLRLPIEVDADQVEATLNDGVLLVKLPKAESAKPRKIKVSQGK